jgi:hypothetical protein
MIMNSSVFGCIWLDCIDSHYLGSNLHVLMNVSLLVLVSLPVGLPLLALVFAQNSNHFPQLFSYFSCLFKHFSSLRIDWNDFLSDFLCWKVRW